MDGGESSYRPSLSGLSARCINQGLSVRPPVPSTQNESKLISCCGQKENIDVQDTEKTGSSLLGRKNDQHLPCLVMINRLIDLNREFYMKILLSLSAVIRMLAYFHLVAVK